MRLPDFKLEQPTSLPEALALAAGAGPGGFDWLGGGTDLLCNYKWGINHRDRVISLRRVDELLDDSPGSLAGGRTLWDVEQDSELAQRFPAIPAAARQIATPLIRRSATLAGNLLLDTRCWHFNQTQDWRVAHGSCLKAESNICRVIPDPGDVCVATYSGDLAPVLMAYGAEVVLEGPGGRRQLPLSRFFARDGIRRFRDKQPEEILVRVEVPREAADWTVAYRKLRLRQAFDFPEGGVAAAVRWEGGRAADLRLSTTAYASIPELHPDLVEPFVGSKLGEEEIARIAQALEEKVQPMKNTSMAPSYRKKMARVLCQRAFQDCCPAL